MTDSRLGHAPRVPHDDSQELADHLASSEVLADAPPSSASPDLEERLRGQIRRWQGKLLDLGNRNPLINCSFNPSRGVIDLLHPDTESVWRELAADGSAGSRPMRFPWRRDLVPPPPGFEESAANEAEGGSKKKREWNPPLEECRTSGRRGERDLLTGLGDAALERRLRTLDGHARLSLSEQGVHCLFVAFGFLKWFESVDSDDERVSPLMLVPVTLSRPSADAPWRLTEAEDDAVDNLCLRERLKQDFGLILPPLPDIDDLEEEGARGRFLDAVREAVAPNGRWEVQDRCALGRFAFPKVAMWQDLGDHAEGVLTNALCRSIGGDATVPPARSFGVGEPLPEAAKLDDVIAPGEVKTILDCDSSQLEAILAARRGVSFVLDGPPGTGKSQTIANIIADALSEGRTVLFVSEKVSALEVVKRRLDDCGLGDFCLECHSSKANRKGILNELKGCLDLRPEVYDDAAPKLDEAHRRRTELNDYVRSIHRRRPPLGLSPYELYGHVSRLHRLGHAARSRCALPDVAGMDRTRFEAWLQLLERAAESDAVIARHDTHPWSGCQLVARSLTFADEMQHHFGRLSGSFRSIHQGVAPLVERGALDRDPSPGELNGLVQSLRESLATPAVPAAWFEAPDEIAAAVLRQLDAAVELARHRSDLTAFVDDVEDRLPDEQVAVLTPANGSDGSDRLVGPLPDSVRGQERFLAEPAAGLRTFLDAAEAASAAGDRVAAALPVPVPPKLSPSKLPALAELARLVASSSPLQPEWLVPENGPRLREASESALASLEEAEAIAGRLANRLPAAHLIGLSRLGGSSDALLSAWETVREIAPEGNADELAGLRERLTTGVRILQDLRLAAEAVLTSLGVGQGGPTLRLARSLERAIPILLGAGRVPAGWGGGGRSEQGPFRRRRRPQRRAGGGRAARAARRASVPPRLQVCGRVTGRAGARVSVVLEAAVRRVQGVPPRSDRAVQGGSAGDERPLGGPSPTADVAPADGRVDGLGGSLGGPPAAALRGR